MPDDASSSRQADPVGALPVGANAQVTEAVFGLLSHVLPFYAARSTFDHALDEAREFALREGAKGETAFRHFDGRVSGTLESRKVKIKITGLSAAQIMRDVVATYCTDPGGAPQRAQIASGARMVHIAASRLSGDRLVRHACYDSVMTDRLTGKRVSAATLLLRPLAPPVLMLRNPIALPPPAANT